MTDELIAGVIAGAASYWGSPWFRRKRGPAVAAAVAGAAITHYWKRIAARRLDVTAREDWESTLIHGTCAPGFESVRQEFVENFRRRGEVGAAVCVYYRGEKVVDLWGGYSDRPNQTPWEEDTLVNVFSATKGIAGLATALQHSRGLLDLDEKVAKYWPDFAVAGKQDVTVKELVGHACGLAAITEPLTLEILADPERTYAAIAKQKMEWATPGDKHGYMAQTLGW